MFNPADAGQLRKLANVCKRSLDEMSRPRTNRIKFYREMLGKHSPYHGTAARRHLNFLDLAVTIYKQSLVPYHPRCSLTARRRDFAPYAYSYELAVNAVLGEEYMSDELETCVLEALLSPLGVLKIMVDAADVLDIDGFQVTTGTPKVKAVTFDNWIQDMSAAGPNAVAFCGDRYFIERDSAMNDGVYDPEAVAKVKPQGHNKPEADESQALRTMQHWEDYRDLLEVWDIWLPNDGLLLTLPRDFDGQPLRVVEWNGPQAGPYERTYFGMIPGNSLPNPPTATWFDLHETANRLYNKCVNQAERQKTNDVIQSGDAQDGEKLKNAKDGDMLALNNVMGKQTLRSGGPDNINLAFTLNAKDQFNTMSGNIFTMGGIAPSSGTVGQDEMISQAASQRLRNMQVRVRDLLRRVVKQIAEYLWESPLVDVSIKKPAAAGRTVDSTWNSEMMPGEFPDYLCDIDPYSLGDRTPGERAMQLKSVWREDIMPAAPLMQAMGQVPNFEGYIKQIAKLENLPEVADMIVYTQGEQMPGEEQVKKPTTTTRKYERTSKSGGATQQGMEQQLMTKLLGSSFNNQE